MHANYFVDRLFYDIWKQLMVELEPLNVTYVTESIQPKLPVMIIGGRTLASALILAVFVQRHSPHSQIFIFTVQVIVMIALSSKWTIRLLWFTFSLEILF